ncbi:hypothetical protein [Pinibacter aurantiacus]|uniref:WG repeat-containing protein n=1 Tax=Pinibacter aurantiacus TaxID=2851599 RepID=A0A9E2S9A0_9BACT|nr:hypothetical protein [Pinibacter aurantiacus]MBV4356979.1 hypothetical protein [Pinibacter aurantiacus]
MKSNHARNFLLFFCCFFFSTRAFSQSTAEDSIAYASAIENAKSIYHKALYPEEGLYTGPEYYGYPFRFQEGQPYYYKDQMDTGWIRYEGVLYQNVGLRYDLIRDQLIVVQPKNNARICVVNDRVNRFYLFNTTFIYLKTDTAKAAISPGIYAVLYEHNDNMLLKRNRKKITEELTTNEGILRYINDNNAFAIKKGNTYYSVGGKKDVLRVYADKKKQLQQYIRRNNLDFRRDQDNALAKSVAYYDSL